MLKSIEGAEKFDGVRADFVFETVRGFYKEFFVEVAIEKGGDYINLVAFEIVESDESYDKLKGREANDGCKGFEVVDSFLLKESFNNLASLKASNVTIRVSFRLKDLATFKGFPPRGNFVLSDFAEDTRTS